MDRWFENKEPYENDDEEAGYANGFETKIYSYVTADLPELPRLAEAVADYLIATIIHTLHYAKSAQSSTADPELDQLIDRALSATDVATVEKLVGVMHRYLYDHANNITIGEIHTNYATNQKITAWDLGRNLYDNNLRYLVRR